MKYLFCFLLSFVITLALTPVIRMVGAGTRSLYKGSQDRWRKKYVSKGGGVAIFAGFIVSVFLFCPIDKMLLGFLAGVLIVFVLGLFDDIHEIKPHSKLIGQLIAATLVVSIGINTGCMSSFLSPYGYVFLIIWIVGITNAFNLLDNMDGLASGVASIAAGFLFVYSLLIHTSQPMLLFMPLALCGAALGFLKYNYHPAKIYMGDSGSMLLGFIISVCSIINAHSMTPNLLLILFVPAMILAVPIFDTTFVMIILGS